MWGNKDTVARVDPAKGYHQLQPGCGATFALRRRSTGLPDTTVGGGPREGPGSSALALKGRGGRTCASWAKEEGRGDAGVIIEKVPERSKTSGCGRRLGVVRRRNSVRL